jgi:solute carrier family 25 (mitochondrial carnitine/acylcarnitine transporter), member 20/29
MTLPSSSTSSVSSSTETSSSSSSRPSSPSSSSSSPALLVHLTNRCNATKISSNSTISQNRGSGHEYDQHVLRSSLLEESLGGLAAGIVGTIIGFPLDLVKTRMQTASSTTTAGSGRTRMQTASSTTTAGSGSIKNAGIVQTARHVVRQEGFWALYKGLVPPLISLSILNTTTFTLYSYFQQSTLLQAERSAWDIGNAAAGAACGVLASPISTVENLVKTQLQLDNVKKQSAAVAAASAGSHHHHHHHYVGYHSTWDCVQQLVTANHRPPGQLDGGRRKKNVLLLYRGHGVNTCREMVFLSTYFYLYEGLRHVLVQQPDRNDHSKPAQAHYWYAIPLAGGLAGASAWVVSFPLDCVRAGVQGQDFTYSSRSSSSSSAAAAAAATASHNNNQILSARQVLFQLLATKGIRGLYAGVTPSLMRAFLVSGSRFSAYEGALWLVRGGR